MARKPKKSRARKPSGRKKSARRATKPKKALIPKTVDAKTCTLTINGRRITYTIKRSKEKLSALYPTQHALRVIIGRAPRDPKYLLSLLNKIRIDRLKKRKP